MSIESSMEKAIAKGVEKGVEKGLVKGVEKLIDKNLVTELTQNIMRTITPEVIAIIKVSLESVLQSVISYSIEPAIYELKETIANIIKPKCISEDLPQILEYIKEIQDLHTLNFIIQNLSLEDGQISLEVFNKYLEKIKPASDGKATPSND